MKDKDKHGKRKEIKEKAAAEYCKKSARPSKIDQNAINAVYGNNKTSDSRGTALLENLGKMMTGSKISIIKHQMSGLFSDIKNLQTPTVTQSNQSTADVTDRSSTCNYNRLKVGLERDAESQRGILKECSVSEGQTVITRGSKSNSRSKKSRKSAVPCYNKNPLNQTCTVLDKAHIRSFIDTNSYQKVNDTTRDQGTSSISQYYNSQGKDVSLLGKKPDTSAYTSFSYLYNINSHCNQNTYNLKEGKVVTSPRLPLYKEAVNTFAPSPNANPESYAEDSIRYKHLHQNNFNNHTLTNGSYQASNEKVSSFGNCTPNNNLKFKFSDLDIFHEDSKLPFKQDFEVDHSFLDKLSYEDLLQTEEIQGLPNIQCLDFLKQKRYADNSIGMFPDESTLTKDNKESSLDVTRKNTPQSSQDFWKDLKDYRN